MALSYNIRIYFPLTGCIVADVRISIAGYIQRRGFADLCIYKIKSKHAKTRRDRRSTNIYFCGIAKCDTTKALLKQNLHFGCGPQNQHRLPGTVVYYDRRAGHRQKRRGYSGGKTR